MRRVFLALNPVFGPEMPCRYALNDQVGHLLWECAPPTSRASGCAGRVRTHFEQERGSPMGSVIKKRRKRMSKKKHRKMLRRTRVQRRKLGK